MQDQPPIPVTLLTGFLGSGKTTLTNRLLRQPAWREALVVLNEFGDVPLDHLLVVHSAETLVVGLGGGCLCCVVRGDLVRTLSDLPWRFSRGGRRQFSRVLIETSGLADPAPILQTLASHPRLAGRYRLEGVAATVDLLRGAQDLDRRVEARRQAALADLLLLTKADLATAAQREALHARLDGINALAPRRELRHGDIDADGLSVPGLGAGPARDGQGAQERLPREHPSAAPEMAAAHGEGVQAFSFTLEAPLSRAALEAWMDEVSQCFGERLLRVKGLLRLADDARPWALHGVGRHWSPLAPAPEQPLLDGRSRLVCITQGVEREALARTLARLG